MQALSDRRITTITRPEYVVVDDNWRDPARTRFDLGYNFYAETTFIKKDAEKAQPQFTPASTTVTRRRLQGKQTAPSAESGARGMVPESEQPENFSNLPQAVPQDGPEAITFEDFPQHDYFEDVDEEAAAAAEIENRAEPVQRIIGALGGRPVGGRQRRGFGATLFRRTG